MKRIAFITDGWARFVTYAWMEGYRHYTACHSTNIDLYVFHSFGNFSKDTYFNTGEYNITRLPDLSSFDGIILDLANIPSSSLKNEIIDTARKASVPVVSLLEEVPDLYFSGIDNYTAIQTVVEHLITKHHCQTLNYISGPLESVENQQRFLAYKDTLRRHNIYFDPLRVTGSTYEIENGIHAFADFQEKDLLPDAFVCANDNIAVGVCLAAREAGYTVPDDFAVTGFDNENKASFFDPRVTTVGFSKADIMYNALALLDSIWSGTPADRCVYAPVTHVFQESCHCVSENPPDRGQYVANHIIDEARESDMQNWMMDLDRFLLDCNSFTELADHLHTWLERHNCGSLNLLMNPDIFQLEHLDHITDMPDDAYLTFGYPKQMSVVYPPSEQEDAMLDLSSGSLIPHIEGSGKQNFYLFSPVHFREREIGYLILENCDYLLDHQFLFETLNTFRTSIEALYGKLLMRKKNKQLSQLYIQDSLTGLYNRMAYEKLALPAFHHHLKNGQPVGIMFVDVDHLKYINDNFGHDMGNLAISRVASVIRQYCPDQTVSMRYGGDEFVCVIPGYHQSQMAKLKSDMEAALVLLSSDGPIPFPIEASIGYAVADEPDLSLNDYINLADEQMYLTKKSRKAARR